MAFKYVRETGIYEEAQEIDKNSGLYVGATATTIDTFLFPPVNEQLTGK